MLFFLTSILIFSSLAMMLLLYVKHLEMRSGRLLFAKIRPHVSAASVRLTATVEQHIPVVLERALRYALHWIRVRVRDIVARILLTVEHSLEAMLDGIKHSLTPPHGASGQASSAFLREVAEHKRKLTRVTRMRTPAKEISAPDQTIN